MGMCMYVCMYEYGVCMCVMGVYVCMYVYMGMCVMGIYYNGCVCMCVYVHVHLVEIMAQNLKIQEIVHYC